MANKVFVSAALLLSSCALAWGQTGKYVSGDNTVEITANNFTLTINVTGDATTMETEICTAIKTAIAGGNYSTITVNGGQINSAIVQSITHSNLTTIDLGTTTVKDFSQSTFTWNHANLQTITLPLTTKDKDAEDKMTVPEYALNAPLFNRDSQITKVIIPEGYTNIGDNAFYGYGKSQNQNVTFTVTLPSTLKEIGTSAFEGALQMTDITLPEGLETIGKRAFWNCNNLTDPKFPSTLKEILSEAYSGALNIKNIKFNDNLEFIGNCAFYCNSAVKECQKTITFPSSLKYMGPGAFYGRRFEDIYFNSVTAPISPIGQISSDKQFYMSAFEDAMHMGNNGFDPLKSENNPNADMANKGFANRENYKNNGGVYFTMLHFPENLTPENVETYTDITRKYDTTNPFASNTQLKVGKEEKTYVFNNGQEWSNYCAPGIVNPGFIDTYRGEQYIWPSQSQWMRSFVCNSLGYKWDGVTEYRPQLTEQQIALMIKDGLTIKNVGPITESNKDTYSDELRKIAYMGTRQFVLANSDHEASNEYKVKDIQGGYWWTLCVPFNMTKKQIDDVFGTGTLVCRFSEVERDDDSNEKKITLKFQHDVYAHKTLKEKGIYAKFDQNADPCNENDTVIYAHESYMIHPTKTNADAVFVVKNYEPIAGSPLPTIVKANDNTEYRFIGNYTVEMSGDETVQMQRIRTVTIPKYSYMYAKKKNEDISMYKFWFYNGGSLKWSSNKCVVQATAKDGGYKDYENFFGTTSQAKQVSIFGSDDIDDKPTEIEHVEIIAGEQPTNNIKYDLYGRHVSDDYKGIYIMNGKKYINR